MFVLSRLWRHDDAVFRVVRALLSLLLLQLVAAPSLGAHEVPRHVGVRAFVAPVADRVRLVVQIPMDAVRDIDWPRRPDGSLDVARALPHLRDASTLWIRDGVTVRDGRTLLPTATLVAVRASLPSDRAFDGYQSALDGIRGRPLADEVAIPPEQLRLEAILEIPLTTPVQDLVIDPRWAHLGVTTTTIMRLVTASGIERVYSYEGDPGALRLDPRWWHAALRFVGEGAQHLVAGLDHLLFLLCLVLPVRQFRPLVGIVTAFTVAHSITLGAAALGFAPTALWFPPLVEVLIAASIVWMALGNIVGARVEQRWKVAFAFGLVHGFGFSTALRDQLQFAGSHLVTSLAAFNVGIELAQLLVLAVTVPMLNVVLTRRIPERLGVIVASALVTHEAWHWMGERTTALRAYELTVPVLDASFALVAVRAALAVCLVTGVAWALQALLARWQRKPSAEVVRTAALLVAALLVVGGARPLSAQARSTTSGVYTPDQAVKGREVFNSNCLGCHTVASHTGTAFQLKWFGRPLADLFDYLSSLMPKSAPGTLTEDEYVWVTAYILRLNGMPPGKTELNAEPAWLKSVRVDSVRTGRSGASTFSDAIMLSVPLSRRTPQVSQSDRFRSPSSVTLERP